MEQSQDLRQLFDACVNGKVDVVNSLLDNGIDLNAADEDDATALQLAAANGQEQVVRLLLVRGAAVDQANSTGWTPLLHAARNGHTSVAALLIQNHASIHALTSYGAGVACLAARSGNLATCRLLEGAGVCFAAGSGAGVRSTLEIVPLVVAAHRGHDSIVKHMLSSADVNRPVKPTGVTALMGAVIGGHVSTARLVIERGKADVDALDINHRSALDYSIALRKHQVKEYLQTKTSRSQYPALRQASPVIIEAVKRGNIEQVREILDGDISQRDACMPQDGATPLMFAAMLGHLQIVQLLVEKGCNINAQDTVNGWTALMQAIFHTQKDVAVYVLHAGADVTVPAKSGCNAFDMASIIADVDTDLYRLIAARAMPVVVPQDQGRSARSYTSSMDTVNQKTGIKAWWSRVAGRFHNLKQPGNISSNVHELSDVADDATLKDSATIRPPSNDALISSLTSNPLTAIVDIGAGNYPGSTDRTVKNNSIFSLDAPGIMTPGSGASTLKSTVPPVFPSPSFHHDRTSKMPPASLRKPLANQCHSQTLSLTRAVSSGIKLLQNEHSTLNLVNRIASPPPRVQFAKRASVKTPPQIDVSPSASCDAATLGGSGSSDAIALPNSKGVLSSTSSSTLTAGSDNNGKASPSVELLRSQRKKLDDNIEPKPIVSKQGQPFHLRAENFGAANHHDVKRVELLRNQHRMVEDNNVEQNPIVGKPGQPFHLNAENFGAPNRVATSVELLQNRRRKVDDNSVEQNPNVSKHVQPFVHNFGAANRANSSSVGKDSGISTGLAPPCKVTSEQYRSVPEFDPTDLGGILQKLSLECYQPIFEEQEVDMEAFLTLTDSDLRELGIHSAESRRQILATISDMNANKDRQREQHRKIVSDFDTARRRTTASEAE